MKFSDLRAALDNYDQGWYFTRWFFGEHQEATQLRRILTSYKSWEQDEGLPHDLLVDLIKTMLFNAHPIAFILPLRTMLLQNNYFFELFHCLDKAGLINHGTFPFLLANPHDPHQETRRTFLYRLFCLGDSDSINVTDICWDLAVFIFNQYPDLAENIRHFLATLVKKQMLDDAALRLIGIKNAQLPFLMDIIEQLEKHGLLNQEVVAMMYKNNIDAEIADKFIHQLLAYSVMLDNDILMGLLESLYLKEITDIFDKLEASHIDLLCQKERLLVLLKNGTYPLQYDLIRILLPILTSEHFIAVFYYQPDGQTEVIIAQLLKRHYQAHDMLLWLLYKQLSSVQLIALQAVLRCAHADLSLQNSEILMSMLMLAIQNPNDMRLKLLERLSDHEITLSEASLAILMQQRENNLNRLSNLLTKLEKTYFLTQATFDAVLTRVTSKLEAVTKNNIIKLKREGARGLSKLTVTEGSQFSFFVEHQIDKRKYERGNFAVIKKGYSSDDFETPVMGIKKLRQWGAQAQEEAAAREVKYNRLLGRQAGYFTKEKSSFKKHTAIFFSWQVGRALADYKPGELEALTIVDKLNCLIMALSELNILHARGRVHGDVKAKNLILDLEHKKLRLIDFGSAHKQGAQKRYQPTDGFHDNTMYYLTNYDFCDDMYSFGFVVALFFPRLFQIEEDTSLEKVSQTIVLLQDRESYSIVEKAIIDLVFSMIDKNRTARCTSEDAKIYCEALVRNCTDLDDEVLARLKQETISSFGTAESVMRGKIL